MKILFIGDIVGKAGRRMVEEYLSYMVATYQVVFCVANCENAAGGMGITPAIADSFFKLGIHILTSGNHIWNKKEILDYLDQQDRLLRPANYPPGVPGKGSVLCQLPGGEKVAIINLQGRIFMDAIDCPFQAADRELDQLQSKTKIILVDMHAETTSEKSAMGWYLDGRVSAVLGTHTHIPTADERVLPGGTAFITDVGMTGPVDSVIGMEKEPALRRFLTGIHQKFNPAKGPGQLNSVLLDIDPSTGRARDIIRVRIDQNSEGQ